jgi:CMP-N-acetylneuraminic acid synthetase
MTTIALLPIKAHSERISGKNFRPFANKPLFRWILDTLLSVPEIEKVVINTDARALLAEHGVTDGGRIMIRDRKPELCGDFTSMNRVLADDIANVAADIYVMTHATNPLLRATTIRSAMAAYQKAIKYDSADSLFSVNRFQSRFYRADASAVNHNPQNLVRTQDLEPWFEENSMLYLFTRSSFAATNARIGRKPLLFETPLLESADIDDKAGWMLAEIIALQQLLASAYSPTM